MPGSNPPYDDPITPPPIWHPVVRVATWGALALLALLCCGGFLLVGFFGAFFHPKLAGIYPCTSCSAPPSLASVSMVSADEGWAVGTMRSKGAIFHYHGVQWAQIRMPGDVSTLNSIDMLSASDGWVIGVQGTILHYTAGQWVRVASPTTSNLSSISMGSAAEGWAVGPEVMLHYTNSLWMPEQPIPNLVSVAMDSASDGWAVGPGVIAHYQEGAWASVTPSFPLTGMLLTSVVMASASEGWAIGNPTSESPPVILHYQNGQWQIADNPLTAQDQLTTIALASPDDGWAMGTEGSASVILHYTRQNGWVRVTTPLKITFHSISMVSPTDGWAVGDDNNFVHYDDGAWC